MVMYGSSESAEWENVKRDGVDGRVSVLFRHAASASVENRKIVRRSGGQSPVSLHREHQLGKVEGRF